MNEESYIIGYHFDRLNLPHKTKFLTLSLFTGLSDTHLLSVPRELPAYAIIEDFYLRISGQAKILGCLRFGLSPALGTLPSDFDSMVCVAPGLYNHENGPVLINLPDPFLLDLHNINHYIGLDPLYVHFFLEFDTEICVNFDFRLKYSVPDAPFLDHLNKLSASKE